MKSVEEILDRALIILLLTNRAMLENKQQGGITYTIEQREKEKMFLIKILKAKSLESACSETEIQVMHTQIGDLSEETFENLQWQFEAIPMLLWSVGLHRLLVYDGQLCTEDFYEILGKYRTSQSTIPLDLKLLSEEDILLNREIAMLWHWRSKEGIGNIHFENNDAFFYICRLFGDEYTALSETIPLSQNPPRDFLVNGVELNNLPEEIASRVFVQSQWRHHTLEWITNQESWEETDTST